MFSSSRAPTGWLTAGTRTEPTPVHPATLAELRRGSQMRSNLRPRGILAALLTSTVLLLFVAACSGDPGTSGAQGPQGAQGAQGIQGPQGPAGAQGIQGSAGLGGARGPSGSQGPQGVPGGAGPKGSTGAQGAAGIQGAPGADGAAGPPGPPGPAGDSGTSAAANMTVASAATGGSTTVWGSGFMASEAIVFVVQGANNGADVILGGTTANASGAFMRDLDINLDADIYTLWAQGNQGSEVTAPLLVLEIK